MQDFVRCVLPLPRCRLIHCYWNEARAVHQCGAMKVIICCLKEDQTEFETAINSVFVEQISKMLAMSLAEMTIGMPADRRGLGNLCVRTGFKTHFAELITELAGDLTRRVDR